MKRLLFISLFFISSYALAGMVSMISSGDSSVPSSAANQFRQFQTCSSNGWSATESQRLNVQPLAGTYDYFRIVLGSAPTAGTSWQFMVRKNSANTTLTCTVVATSSSCADTTHSFVVASSDTLDIQSIPTGSPPTPTTLKWGTRYTSNNNNESPLMFASNTNTTVSATRFYPVQNDLASAGIGTVSGASDAIPTGGSISSLWVKYDGSMVTNSTVTLELNGADTALSCQVPGGQVSCNDTSDSINVVVGDTVAWKIQTGSTGRRVSISASFNPTTNGESIFSLGSTAISQNSSLFSLAMGGISNNFGAAESLLQSLMIGGASIKKFYASGSPASGQTATYTARINGSNTALANIITGPSTSANDTSDTVSVNDDDQLSVSVVTSATSGAVTSRWGIVYFVSPGGVTVTPQRTLRGIGI